MKIITHKTPMIDRIESVVADAKQSDLKIQWVELDPTEWRIFIEEHIKVYELFSYPSTHERLRTEANFLYVNGIRVVKNGWDDPSPEMSPIAVKRSWWRSIL